MLVWAQSLPQPVGIRCGINAGQLEFVHDPYDTLHVCGAPINEAQRIMDAAQDGQMFVHAEYFAARLYFVAETHHPDLHYRRHPETYEILAKHGKLLHVQSITGSFPPHQQQPDICSGRRTGE